MSLLSVCQDVADVIGLARPVAIMAGQDQLPRQMLGLCRKTLEELGLMDWPVLEIPYTFDTINGQGQYDLPGDFGREVGDTVYLATQYNSLRGSLTPSDWQRQKTGLQANLGRYRFRIFGLPLKLSITPTPSVVETLLMEYQTTSRVRQLDGGYKPTFFADSDVTLMPEELLKKGLEWRLRRAKGLDYSEEFDDYEMSRASRLAQALSMGSMPIAYRPYNDGDGIAYPYVPEAGFG